MPGDVIAALPAGTVLDKHGRQLPRIQRLVKFVCFVYAKWWFTCSSGTSAPQNDLQLLKDLYLYKEVDREVAQIAIKTFSNHLWYLTAELVPLALFSERVQTSTKQAMVDRLLSFPKAATPRNRTGTDYGKPCFPSLPEEAVALKLENFIGEDSWLFFAAFDIFDEHLLSTPVSQWDGLTSYERIKATLTNFIVTNDVAERGVKLAHEKVGSATIEERFQNIVQVVAKDSNGSKFETAT